MSWSSLNRRIVACARCPRLIDHCQQVAREKRRAYLDWDYWGRPVPNFGDSQGRLLIVGLAPAAHGANRTGRMFTGDRSGEWLYRALHRAGFASQPTSTSANDSMRLGDCAITAICHCAPPDNQPSPGEIAHCGDWLTETIDVLPVRVFLALGQIAWKGLSGICLERGWLTGQRPKFAHGQAVSLTNGRWLIGSYHPSQQNTFTGRLAEAMLDSVFERARHLLADR